ncbi:virB8 family protein [Acidovorax sp. LjRoot129]|uniref:virB8 family protein n=1 Tax=Acidovorax sp. LjRoot129 TaxID=3342260 RepID=UPI003ED02291
MFGNKKPKSEIDRYTDEVRSWETDKVMEAAASKRLAWRVTGASLATALLAVGAVIGLTPLKSVEPYVIRVDNSTGVVDVQRALQGGDTNYNEAVNKYFAQLYVRNREGYNRELSAENYYSVGLMSNNIEQERYFNFFNPKNPQSPLVVFNKYAKVGISVKTTTFIKPNVALVRYVREIIRGSDKPEISHWAATITFRYVGAPMTDKDRAINPLGFQVVDYRTDPESLTAVERSNYLPTQPSLAVPAEPAASTTSESLTRTPLEGLEAKQ